MLLDPAKKSQGGTVGNAISIRFFAIALLVMPLLAHAVGLGRLSVLSALGQPLEAEIELVSVRSGEEASLKAQLAGSEAFRQAGIEYNPTLAGVRFNVVKRGSRRIIRLTSTQPVNEPFLDVLVELQWASGRLVREYTFLLDPPELRIAPRTMAAAPVAPAIEPASTVEKSGKVEPRIEMQPATPKVMSTAGTYQVNKGDTLSKIANAHMQPGVTLNQMLIALYRANREAFINNNINLVRAGRILNIPDRDAIASIDGQEAYKVVATHMAQFGEFRRKLAAAAPAADTTPGQQSVSGKIQPKAQAEAPAGPRDRLKLSKAEASSSPTSRAASGDAIASAQRALKEAESRVADLEKNVSDLQKLLELKNQQLAELAKKADGKPEVPSAAMGTKATTEAPKPAPETPKPAAETPKPAAEAPKPAAEAPKPAAEAPKPKPAVTKPTPKPAAKPKPRPAPPPPPPPSVVDEFLNNPVALGSLGGVVLLLGGYGAWQWRRKKAAQSQFDESVLGDGTAVGGDDRFSGEEDDEVIAPVSSGGQAQAASAPADVEEVDPIAEADVYMAYGRDGQAEEILTEALQKDMNRPPVHSKLLEIYAGRRDVASFERTAVTLRDLVDGEGPEWDKTVSLGRTIDPDNPLYGGAGGGGGAPVDVAAPVAAPALDFDIDAAAEGDGSDGATEDPQAEGGSIDFDLGTGGEELAAEDQTDFAPSGTLIMDASEAQAASGGLDFDLGMGGDTDQVPQQGGETLDAAEDAQPEAADGDGGMDFDLDLDLGAATGEVSAAGGADVDLSSISLDLDGTGGSEGGADPKWQEVATKLDLAKAYEEMGDKDGARELLNEVIREGDAAQQSQAQQMMEALG